MASYSVPPDFRMPEDGAARGGVPILLLPVGHMLDVVLVTLIDEQRSGTAPTTRRTGRFFVFGMSRNSLDRRSSPPQRTTPPPPAAGGEAVSTPTGGFKQIPDINTQEIQEIGKSGLWLSTQGKRAMGSSSSGLSGMQQLVSGMNYKLRINAVNGDGKEGMYRAEMSHPWMYGNRCAPAFREGVNSFLLVAEANKSKQGFMCCPCLKCKNEKDYSCSRDIKSHLLRFGFMSSYNVWTKHGEEGVMMEDGDEEEDNDDQYRSMFSECDDTAMDDNEEEGGEEHASDDPVDDDLRRAISDARRDCGTDKERLQFDKMLEDHQQIVVPRL
ncbi:hypothetical protein QYE76_069874 [Lolium multiflorum]|uniref:Transposase-associated domain-containing protein n=1 Tax=Lolium multiflorum TaxID=4521 RepID=A0AAD8WFC2_LOLMU|nr:hypothetical protein QYE76_069874 [Lolium multiflorum]